MVKLLLAGAVAVEHKGRQATRAADQPADILRWIGVTIAENLAEGEALPQGDLQTFDNLIGGAV